MKTFEDFLEKYTLINNPLTTEGSYNNFLFETYGEELKIVQSYPNCQIWTLMTDDYGSMIIIPDYYKVNRIGYFISKECFENENEIYNTEELIPMSKIEYFYEEYKESNKNENFIEFLKRTI